MMDRFFKNLQEHTGVFTPAATVKTSILRLLQRLQRPFSNLRHSFFSKKTEFFGLVMAVFDFFCDKH